MGAGHENKNTQVERLTSDPRPAGNPGRKGKDMQTNYELGACRERYKLFEDTYMFVFDTCIAIAKTDKTGNIIRLSTFGKGADNDDKGNP